MNHHRYNNFVDFLELFFRNKIFRLEKYLPGIKFLNEIIFESRFIFSPRWIIFGKRSSNLPISGLSVDII
jgi:hypothetical protein